MKIDELLKHMVNSGGSDAHLKVGMPPGIRITGKIQPQGTERLLPEHTQAIARDLLDQDEWEKFSQHGDIDCSYSLPGVGRFRVNVMRQRGSISLVLRYIPDNLARKMAIIAAAASTLTSFLARLSGSLARTCE